jgi:site-specific recombinase XerD
VSGFLGAFRKGSATEALKAGVDVVGLAHLLGHRDTSMLARTYAKVQQGQEYMASLAQKANAPRAANDNQPPPQEQPIET